MQNSRVDEVLKDHSLQTFHNIDNAKVIYLESLHSKREMKRTCNTEDLKKILGVLLLKTSSFYRKIDRNKRSRENKNVMRGKLRSVSQSLEPYHYHCSS